MRYFLKSILSLFVMCILFSTAIAKSDPCVIQPFDKMSNKQIMTDCHNINQSLDDKTEKKSKCDYCSHCMQFVHLEAKFYKVSVPYNPQYPSALPSFTSYFHILESPPPKG